MGISHTQPTVRVRVEEIASTFTVVGDSVIAHVDEEIASRRWCPEHLEHLQDRPGDLDDAVAVLRWSVAWHLETRLIDDLAEATGVPSRRLLAFMEAEHDTAGDLLTFAEAARLIRATENRIEDRELADQCDEYRRLAQPYVEAAGLHYGEALRRAHEVRDAYRAANPTALTLGVD